jgi:hypothetical protein
MTPTAPARRAGPRQTVPRLILGAAGALTVQATPTVILADTRPPGQQDPDQLPVTATPDPAGAGRLRDLADHITSVPADHHSGPYTYTHSQGCNGVDFLNADARIGRVDVQNWQHVNRSARLTSRRLPSGPGLDHVVGGSARPQFADAPLEAEGFTAVEGSRPIAIAPEARRSAAARPLSNGTWVADTDAVDHLIGRWDTDRDGRVDGCGYHAVAEIARHADPQIELLPTVNDNIDSGGAVIKVWLVVNDAMAPHVDPSSYRVHIPPGSNRRDWPSDHRLVTAAFDLTEQVPTLEVEPQCR